MGGARLWRRQWSPLSALTRSSFNARVLDPYATNDFAQGFEDDGSSYSLFAPSRLPSTSQTRKKRWPTSSNDPNSIVIIGTETYQGQGADWWYLAAAGGQHVFFYTQNGMAVAGGSSWLLLQAGGEHSRIF